MASSLSPSLTVVGMLLLAISGASAGMSCEIFDCPNLATKVYTSFTESDSLSYCCKTQTGIGKVPYCCELKEYMVYYVGMDPKNMPLSVDAFIGIIAGSVVAAILVAICCCCCCFRKRTIVHHQTVAYGNLPKEA